MSRTILNRLVHVKLQEISPEVYEQCEQIAKPPFNDVTLVPAIIEQLVRRNEPTPENLPFLIGVVYYLIAPHKLHSQNIRLALGIRDMISDSLGFNNSESVNHYSKYLIPNWKNSRFRQRIEKEANEVMLIINKQ
jgi:hypothetical protein